MNQKIFLSGVIILLVITGCMSGHNNPTSTSLDPATTGEDDSLDNPLQYRRLPNSMWGLWRVEVNKFDGSLDVVPLRGAMFNANVNMYLAPPYSPTSMLSVKILPASDIPNGYLDLEVGLRHPFIGQNRFKGFDVRCIFMADGSVVSEQDPAIIFSGAEAGEAYMLNPDGYTRFWNATEFTDPDPLFSFTPGQLGSDPDPTATLNPYKYFADDLSIDSDVKDMSTANRGVFSPDGDSRVRNFKLQFPVYGGPQIIFNYGVDASWAPPDPGGEPEYPVESFPPNAQTQEAYHVDIDTSGTNAWFDGVDSGGAVNLSLEIFDWQAVTGSEGVSGEILSLWVESPIFTAPLDLLPIASVTDGSKPTSSVFTVELDETYLNLTDSGLFRLLGSVESVMPDTYEPQFPGGDGLVYPEGTLAAYFMGTISIGDSPPPIGWELIFPDPIEQISDSGGKGWNNNAPRAIIDGQGRLVVAWSQDREEVPDQLDARPVDRISENDGNSWNLMDTFPISFFDRPGQHEGTKMALDANGDAYALNFWHDTDPDWYYTHWLNYLIRCPFDDESDWGWQTAMCVGGVELAFTTEGYPVCFEDFDLFPGYTGIQAVKGLWQNSPLGLESGPYNEHSWMHIGQYYEVYDDTISLSTGPSVQRDAAGTIWLAYHDGFVEYEEDSDAVFIVYSLDNTMENWSVPLAVANAVSTGDKLYNPSMWLDSDGAMYLTFFRSTVDGYSLCYLLSETGDPGDFGVEEVIFSDLADIGHPTITVAEIEGNLIPLATYVTGAGEILASWRDPVDEAWNGPLQVDLNTNATTPAVWVDSVDNLVHVLWAEPDLDGYSQIMYRRGTFTSE